MNNNENIFIILKDKIAARHSKQLLIFREMQFYV